MKPPVKQHWIERAIQTEAYHIDQCKKYPGHKILDTSDELNRSSGSITEDLLIASFMKTHENQIRRMPNKKDALVFIREKKAQQKLTPYSE